MSKRETAAEKIAKLEAEVRSLTNSNTILKTRLNYMLETFQTFAAKVDMLKREP